MPNPPVDVIVLAAGKSSRMGEPKGLVIFRGRPWLVAQLDAIAQADGRAIVVLGADRDSYLKTLPELPAVARLAWNDDPDRGPFSSLQCGLRLVESGKAAFVLPVDVPAPALEVWSALRHALEAMNGQVCDAAVPEHSGRGGHPILLSPQAVHRLLERPADSRLDAELIALPRDRVARVPVLDARVRLNLNAPEDWVKLELGQ